MNPKFFAVLLALGISVVPVLAKPVNAQMGGGFVGPNAAMSFPLMSVTELLKQPDNTYARVQGYIKQQLPGKSQDYIFVDKQGKEMRVEIKHHHFAGQTIDEKTLVELTGKLDKEWVGRDEFEVKGPVEIVKK